MLEKINSKLEEIGAFEASIKLISVLKKEILPRKQKIFQEDGE